MTSHVTLRGTTSETSVINTLSKSVKKNKKKHLFCSRKLDSSTCNILNVMTLQGHTKDYKNGTYDLPAWHSVFGIGLEGVS